MSLKKKLEVAKQENTRLQTELLILSDQLNAKSVSPAIPMEYDKTKRVRE
jgi:hypothetical protein